MRLRRYRPITGLLAALVLGCNAPPADNPAPTTTANAPAPEAGNSKTVRSGRRLGKPATPKGVMSQRPTQGFVD